MFQSQHLIFRFSRLPLSPPSPSSCFLPRTAFAAPRAQGQLLHTIRPAHALCLAQMGEPAAAEGGQGEATGEGPVLLSPSTSSSIFATTDDPSPLQVSTSVLLTGAISVFLFRSLRRRAKRAKEMRVRSTGLTKAKGLKEEAIQSLKEMRSASIEPGAPPSPVQALLGGIAAGVIAVILYKFTTTIEASLNRQAISDNFSVRQITITIRTIVNGLCYLATFIFGINAVGLVLYSGQLAFSSLIDPSTTTPTPTQNKGEPEERPDTAEPPAKASGGGNADSDSPSTQQTSSDET